MKVTCGTDIIEIERIKESIDTIGDKFLKRVFTEKEIAYCESKKQQKYQHFAARFAAKEAAYKAVSESLNDKYALSWQDVEVSNDKNGKPIIIIKKIKMDQIENIDISISHCKEYACANVVVLYK